MRSVASRLLGDLTNGAGDCSISFPEEEYSVNLLTSIRRTVIPFIMGWLLSLPIGPYIATDAAAVEAGLAVIIGAIYYVVMRVAEEQGIPVASFFLAFGRTTSPIYAEDTGLLAEVSEDERLDTDGGDGSVANS
jgi:hypothetical protein